MLDDKQLKLFEDYRDKSYVMNVLLTKSYERFSMIKQLCNIPLILSSCVMAIINASQKDANDIKSFNITINSITVMLLSLISNFKVQEKETLFQTLSNKFMKLTHKIEDDLANNFDFLERVHLQEHIQNYDILIEQITETIPRDIQNKVKQMYCDKKTLPAFLNCECSFVRKSEIGFYEA